MIVAKCIRKMKDASGRGNQYILKDLDGKTVTVNGAQLKEAMSSGKIIVTDLEISEAGRLQEKTLSKAEEVLEYIYEALYDLDNYPERWNDDYVYCMEAITERIELYFGKPKKRR